jgi:hypothetical protein
MTAHVSAKVLQYETCQSAAIAGAP